jgi:PEGA domain/Trypsin-like peptidase domain/Curli production assembly/transport component CsgG
MISHRRILATSLLALAWVAAAIPAAAAGADRADLYQRSERAEALVVRLTGPNTDGAGILVNVDDKHAYGVTAKHVVFQQGRVVEGLKARLRAWPGQVLDARATRMHHREDLAVFEVDLGPLGLSLAEIRQGIPFDQLGVSTALDPGDPLFTVGHATAGAWITPKEPARFARGEAGDTFLFELPCAPGHSGGGVFDGDWQLVGMMIEEERPYCRALRIEPVLRMLQSWTVEISLRKAAPKGHEVALPEEIKVAVVDFDNRSGEDLPELGSVAQDVTTSFLVTVPRVVLVTRDRLDSVRKEITLPGSIQTAAGMSRVGRLLDADILVTGSILRYDVERRLFDGFGTSARQDIYRMAISLQVIDVDSGRVRFSKTFEVERKQTYPKATSAPSRPVNRISELLSALLDQAQKDLTSALMQVAAGLGAAGQFVQVPVTSRPAGADVILNGVYMGSTPLNLQLTLDSHEIAIELPGYQPWRRRVKVNPGMTIEVNLAPMSH